MIQKVDYVKHILLSNRLFQKVYFVKHTYLKKFKALGMKIDSNEESKFFKLYH